MSNKKSPQAFPGRTGMGYENGLSKLEWMATTLLAGNMGAVDPNPKDAVEKAKELLKLCAEQDSN